ncbi:MAG: hypothetical protein IJ704_03330 [Bacilli bacterium]|nr:hypothetical protein [Bacilli bacterium]
MKKGRKVFYEIILLFLMMIAFMQSTKAASIQVYRRASDHNADSFLTSKGKRITINYYTAVIDGKEINTTYCADPRRPWGTGLKETRQDYNLTVNLSKDYNSSTYKRIAYAYKASQGSSRKVQELLFRWIINTSPYASNPVSFEGVNYADLNQFSNSDAEVAEAKRIYTEAVNASALSYDELVSQGSVWGVQWGTASYTETSTGTNTSKVTFVLNSVNGTVPALVYYNNFTAKCTNTNVKCTMSSAGAYNGAAGVQIDMTVEKLNGYTGTDYGIEVTPAYCDPQDAAMQVFLVSPTRSGIQRMLVIMDGSCPVSEQEFTNSVRRPGRPSIHITSGPSCICDTTTGLYKVTKNKTTTTYSTLEEAKKAAGSDVTCPGTCEKKNTCYRDDSGKPHCKNGEVCTEEEFKKECQHSCQNPSESGDGKYYCKESTPGAGDGKECSKEEYIKDCQKCDEWEDKCKDNQNPSDPECQDYNQYCVDCTPNVYMPATCNNFDNLDSQVNGVISDISQTSAGRYSCQNESPKDQIKSCVINRSDAAGNSYNATSTSGISGDNPYCQVWCKESYKFNVPTARTTNSGSYFTIDASIEGTRDCYVSGHDDPSKGIDTVKFRNKIRELTDEMLRNYTEYVRWKTALNSITSKSESADGLTESYPCGGEDDDDDDDAAAAVGTANLTIDESAAVTRFIETTPNMNINLTKVEDGGDCGCDSYVSCSATIYYVPSYTYSTYTAIYNADGTISHISIGSSSQSENIVSPDGEAIDASSCGSDGTCRDGSADVVRGRVQPNVDKYKKAYEDNLKDIKNNIRLYNSCTGNVNNPNDTSVNVTGWDNKMVNWNSDGPEVYMNYKEDYIKDFNTLLDANYDGIQTTEEYCFGDTDSTYKCISGGSANSSSNAIVGTNIIYCDDSSCVSNVIQVGKSNWIRKTKVQSAHYEPNNDLSVRSQYGTVQFKSAACNGNDCLYTNLPKDSIPVSLLTKTGVFPFVLSYNKVGQSNQDNSLGRIINTGSTKSVLTEYTRKVNSGEYKKCSISTMQQQVGYVCHYLTNCDDHCKFKCDPDGKCYFEECEDGNCTFTCRDCIFDGENFTYSFRPVSLSTLFPNERSKNSDEGYNWTNDYKGSLTRKIIENGYNRGSIKLQGGDESYVTPEYSYTLSAMNLKNIKGYNGEVGTFANSTIPSKYENMSNNTTTPKNSAIYCSNMSINGIDYSVKCNSAFLDVIENDSSHKFAISSIRPEKNQRFILFTDLVSVDPDLQKTCANNKCITRENAIGPSWK